jgi:tRNA 2-thiouridine synthesizing protein A
VIILQPHQCIDARIRVPTGGINMATQIIDAVGLRCPQPILKLTIAMPDVKPGDIVELRANCDTFEEDIRAWCGRMSKTLLAVTENNGVFTATIQF